MNNNKNTLYTIFFALIGCSLALYLILGLDTFFWDEAHHAFFSSLIYHDLKTFNIAGFFTDTGRQGWFQPFHSYLNAVSMLLFGHNYFAVRLSSLLVYLSLFLIIYKFSTLISKENGWKISAIASFLLATSPKMLVMASVNLQEMMGACIIMLALLYYVEQKDGNIKSLILGFILSMIFLTKYQFGFLLGGTVFLIELSKIFDVPNRLIGFKNFCLNNLLIFAGYLPLTIIWFVTPDSPRKIGLFFHRMSDAQAWNRGFNMLQRVAFYLQSILTEYSVSIIVGVFLIFSILYSFRYFRDLKIRSLIALFMTFFIFHSFTPAIFERLITPAMPALYILAGITAVDLYSMIKPPVRNILLIIVAVILLGDIAYLPQYAKQVNNYSFTCFSYKQNIQDLSPRTLYGLIKIPKYFMPYNSSLDNYARFKQAPKNKLRDILDFYSANIPKGKPISTMISFMTLSPYELYWHFDGWGAQVFTMNDYAIQGKYFWFSEYYISLDVADDSPYKSEIGEDPKHWTEASKPYIQRGWLKLIATKEFKDLGLTANIYKMKLPF